jgi:hypothetical protein
MSSVRRIVASGLILSGLICLLSANRTFAQSFDQGAVLTMVEENDLVVDTDRHYTQGIKFSFLTGDNHLPDWAANFLDWLPSLGLNTDARRIGTQIGQSIYTPADLQTTQLITNDRPYAGWLYTGLILQRRGWSFGTCLTLDHLQMDLGIIGPESLAEEAQTWVHEVRGFETPKGWDNQLHDEPGIAIKYQRLWRFSLESDRFRYADFIPKAGMCLGNVETSFRIGGTVRAGFNLPDDFGVQTISSLATTEGGWSETNTRGRLGFYVFTGIEGWAVAHSAFLDGNLYRSSPSVDRKWFVGEWQTGAALVLGHAEIGFTYVFRTPEFLGQTEDNGYGSAWCKIKF